MANDTFPSQAHPWKMFPWDKTANVTSFNPLHALATGVGAISGGVDKANIFEQLFGGGGKKAAASGPDPTTAALANLGISGQSAQGILDQVNRAAQIAKLPKELQQPVTQYFQQQQSQQQQQPFIDPLVMQMFFANTIAPYLQQQTQDTSKQIGDLYDSEEKNMSPYLDKGTKSILSQMIPGEKAAALNVSNAQGASYGPGAAIQAIMQQLANSQQTQQQYAADIRNNLAQNALSSLLGGAGGSAFTAPTKTG